MGIQRQRSLFPGIFLRGNQHIHCFILCNCPRNFLQKYPRKGIFLSTEIFITHIANINIIERIHNSRHVGFHNLNKPRDL